jgi:hypothetical protein
MFIVCWDVVDLILTHIGLTQLQIYNFKSGSWNEKIRTWHEIYTIQYTQECKTSFSNFVPQTYDGEHLMVSQTTLHTCQQTNIYMAAKKVLWSSFWLWFEPPSQ